MYSLCRLGRRTEDTAISPVWIVRILLLCELCTTKNTPIKKESDHNRNRNRGKLTTGNDTKQHAHDKVPHGHTHHDADNRQIFSSETIVIINFFSVMKRSGLTC